MNEKYGLDWETSYDELAKTQKQNVIIPTDRLHYLREISDTVRGYHKKSEVQEKLARKLFQLEGAIEIVNEKAPDDVLVSSLQSLANSVREELTSESKRILANWES